MTMSTQGDGADEPSRRAPVRLGPSTGDLVSLFVLAPTVGVAVGVALPWVARWVADLPWAPFQGPLELVASMETRGGMVIGVLAGVILGVALAVTTSRDATRVTVDPDTVTVENAGGTRSVARSEVSAVFLDRKHLAVLDTATREVVHVHVDATSRRIEKAFRQHGYPWCHDDPHGAAFQRWVPDSPELPDTVNAVFAAREASLREKDIEDAADLRAELAKSGYVVRDQKTRQYWRPTKANDGR